ncbi:MAG: hypothetical protein V2J20_13940 [Wenzhouxiangella sp.]|jgi:hypothetical protein|nr:hypothetical protein [Wenzhouxiangella sp.]
MPKPLLGCLMAAALLVVGGGVAGYFLVFKPAYQFASDVGRFTSEFVALNDEIERDQRYQPPLEGMLSPQQLERYLAVQRDIRAGMQGQLDQLTGRFERVNSELERQERDTNILDMITAYRDLGDLILAAKQQQVQAINAHGFSLQEYLYIRNISFRALGEDIAVAAFGQQGAPPMVRELPEDVVELVRAHREELMKSYPLAWFGL